MTDQKRRAILDGWLGDHRGLLFRIIRAYAFNDADRDDLFQETALQLWHSIPRFREESAVTTWMYRVALYTALAWSRRERRERRTSIDGHEPALRVESVDADPRLDWLYERIAALDPVDRSLAVMLLDGCSYTMIGTALGMTDNHVGVRIHRIKHRLRSEGLRSEREDAT